MGSLSVGTSLFLIQLFRRTQGGTLEEDERDRFFISTICPELEVCDFYSTKPVDFRTS